MVFLFFQELVPAFRCNLFFQKRISTAIGANDNVPQNHLTGCEGRKVKNIR